MRKSKIVFSVILALIITVTSLSVGTMAAEDYSKKTVSSIWADATKNLLEKIDCETKLTVDKNGKEQKVYIYDIKKCEPIFTIKFSDGTNVSGSIEMIEKQTDTVFGGVIRTEQLVSIHKKHASLISMPSLLRQIFQILSTVQPLHR